MSESGDTIEVDRSASIGVQFGQAFVQSLQVVAPYVLGWTFGLGFVGIAAGIPLSLAYFVGQWVLHQNLVEWVVWPAAIVGASVGFSIGLVIIGTLGYAIVETIGAVTGDDDE